VAGGLRFGIQTPQYRTWPELVERWRLVEALGFDSCWLADHYVPPFWVEGPFLEAWTLLAALATKTERIRLGVLVSCNTFRHPPLVAKQAATVDHLSSGRLEFGLGAGWFVAEHEMFGVDFPEAPELVGRFREAVELVDLLLRQDVTTYEGTYYRVKEALFRPGPVQQPRPPLTLGAHGPRMLRIVARYGDRWNSNVPVAEMAERNRVLDEQCAAVGRDPRAIVRSHLYVTALLPDERPWDSPDAFRDFVGRLREAGVSEFILHPPPDSKIGMLERVAAEVIPELRAGMG
jgi:F420-dependent oxidoreductase-like protein